MYRPQQQGKDKNKAPPRGVIVCMPRRAKAEDGLPDILWYKQALNRLGYYVPESAQGITDDARDPAYRDALHAFQRAQTIPFGDTPGPGSVTERKLTEALEDVGASERYIWRTAGDDKVRHDHALRDGRVYSWNDPPEGDDHPGDDYNCRCWAEPLNPARHPWAAWARTQQAEREAARADTLERMDGPRGVNLDPLSPPDDAVPTDAINPVYPVETLLGLLSGAGLARGVVAKTPSIAKIVQDQVLKNARNQDQVFQRPKGIPDDWVAQPVKKGIGMIYRHPKEIGTYVKVQRARAQSTQLGQKYDNVRWQKNGKSLDANGNSVKQDSLESHIPIKEFKFNWEKIK